MTDVAADSTKVANNENTVVTSVDQQERKKEVVIEMDNLPNKRKNMENKTMYYETKSVKSTHSKSSFALHNRTWRVNTCFGTVELTLVKVLSFLGMLVNIAAFIALTVIIIYAFAFQSSTDIDLLLYRGDIMAYGEVISASVRYSVYTNNTKTYVTRYYSVRQKLTTTLNNILAEIPKEVHPTLINVTSFNSSALPNFPFEDKILALAQQGRKQEALAIIDSQAYSNASGTLRSVLSGLLAYSLDLSRSKQSYLLIASSINLGVIAVSLLIVVPVIITVFLLTINRDHVNLERLKKANAIMLIDTMSDSKLRELFKKHCEEEHSTENFLFLEKVQYYKQFCEKYLEKDDSSESTTSGQNSSSNNSSSNKSKMKKNASEQDFQEIEKKKYELAFEIYTDFLDLRGETPINVNASKAENVKRHIDNFTELSYLPESLFDTLEQEVAILMLDTHHRFKNSLAFQKHLKINKIKKKHTKTNGK
ncbi:hypothetical protein ABK040_008098 [Willaertia magna]